MNLRRVAGDVARAFAIYLIVAASGGAGLADPTASASADTLGSQVAQTDLSTESCSHTLTVDGATVRYAEHPYNGRPATTLGRISVLGHRDATKQAVIPGYEYEVVTQGVYVRDGAVAVVCNRSGAADFDQVLFVMPRTYRLDTTDPWAPKK